MLRYQKKNEAVRTKKLILHKNAKHMIFFSVFQQTIISLTCSLFLTQEAFKHVFYTSKNFIALSKKVPILNLVSLNILNNLKTAITRMNYLWGQLEFNSHLLHK